ncbi:MAG: hypothetical protein ACI9TY_001370 [Alphaproteobacteria bacterium]|jgi:hypothetical protein
MKPTLACLLANIIVAGGLFAFTDLHIAICAGVGASAGAGAYINSKKDFKD